MWRLSLLVLIACHDHVATCADDLQGVWRAPDGARWLILDDGPVLEGYPLDPDAPQGSDHELVAAPRALDLTRGTAGLTGSFVRRYERRRGNCEAHSAVHLESCHDDTIELVTSELPQPIAVAPCRWSVAAPSHLERWHRLN
ncbi:MAG: hypothetical protein ABI591_01415 [Kofleriaceae bacterium]